MTASKCLMSTPISAWWSLYEPRPPHPPNHRSATSRLEKLPRWGNPSFSWPSKSDYVIEKKTENSYAVPSTRFTSPAASICPPFFDRPFGPAFRSHSFRARSGEPDGIRSEAQDDGAAPESEPSLRMLGNVSVRHRFLKPLPRRVRENLLDGACEIFSLLCHIWNPRM